VKAKIQSREKPRPKKMQIANSRFNFVSKQRTCQYIYSQYSWRFSPWQTDWFSI